METGGDCILQRGETIKDVTCLFFLPHLCRNEQTATLKVDEGRVLTGASPGKLRQLNGDGHLLIGGAPHPEHVPLADFRTPLVGCVGDLSAGRAYNVDLLAEADAGVNVEACRMDDF